MKKAYLAISYTNRKAFDKEINCLHTLLSEYGIELLVFVDKYNFREDQENEMMKTAFSEIDSSDMLIAELTTKSIGVGIEVGYAYARDKTILYLRKKGAEYSTTVAGSSDYIIEYRDGDDLMQKIRQQLFK